jgi:hypothetical protein
VKEVLLVCTNISHSNDSYQLDDSWINDRCIYLETFFGLSQSPYKTSLDSKAIPIPFSVDSYEQNKNQAKNLNQKKSHPLDSLNYNNLCKGLAKLANELFSIHEEGFQCDSWSG